MAPTIHFKDDAHRFAGLIVLKAPDVPSVLLETGYISNDDDLGLLLSTAYRRNIAIGVRKAISANRFRPPADRRMRCTAKTFVISAKAGIHEWRLAQGACCP